MSDRPAPPPGDPSPPPPPPPPSFVWQPAPPGYMPHGYAPHGYTPHGYQPPGHPGHGYAPAVAVEPPVAQPQPRRRGGGGIAGSLLAALAAFFKYGFALFKFGKLGGTFLSMLVSAVIYVGIFGWQFGIGVLLLILVHEMGHMAFAKYEGLPVSAPFFLGPFGAVISVRKSFVDARQEAVVAIGGPIVGTAASLLLFVLGESMSAGYAHNLMLALAEWGCLINLFNLIPMVPLDGGRVASALSKWVNVAGVAILAGFWLLSAASGYGTSPILPILLLLGVFSTWQRFSAARRGQHPPPLPTQTRVLIGVSYLLVVLMALLGHTAAHNDLVQTAGTTVFG